MSNHLCCMFGVYVVNLLFHLSNPNPGLSKPVTVLAHNIKISTDKNFIKQLRDKYGKENIKN